METPALRPVVVNYGLGVDSTAWLLYLLELLAQRRLLGDAGVRERAGLPADSDLDQVIVITAMTGSEHPDTARLVEEHMLPRLAVAGLRYVQVARGGSRKQTDVALLDDSRAPTRLHAEGELRLFDEMTRAGTLPTTGLVRKCSIKAKGWPIDAFLDSLPGGAFYQVMGFEDSPHERKRAARDSVEGARRNPDRIGVYPLIDLGWDRARCLAYITDRTGAAWRKSACGFCPFRMTHRAGLAEVLDEWRQRPELAVEALVMDHAAVALNPAMGLVAGQSIWEVLDAASGMKAALSAAERRLDAMAWGLYEVRRGFKSRRRADGRPDPTKRGFTVRCTRQLATGSRPAMRAALQAAAHARQEAVDGSDARHPRVWIRRRGDLYPTREHLLTIAPAFVESKQGAGFGAAWNEAEQTQMELPMHG